MVKNIIKTIIIQLSIAIISIFLPAITFSGYPNYNVHSNIFYTGLLIFIIYFLCGMWLTNQKSKLYNFLSILAGYLILSILIYIVPKDISFFLFSFVIMIVNPTYFESVMNSSTVMLKKPYFYIFLFLCMLFIWMALQLKTKLKGKNL